MQNFVCGTFFNASEFNGVDTDHLLSLESMVFHSRLKSTIHSKSNSALHIQLSQLKFNFCTQHWTFWYTPIIMYDVELELLCFSGFKY